MMRYVKQAAIVAALAGLVGCGQSSQSSGATASAVSGGGTGGASGATLQASKTLDICVNADGSWTYSGEVSVWNTGLNDASGLNITDCLQYKSPSSNKQPQNVECLSNVQGSTTTIPGLTEYANAYTFAYSFSSNDVLPDGSTLGVLDVNGTIRNSASVTIANHSGGVTQGPTPKYSWAGGTPPACQQSCGCALTQGYWGTHYNNASDCSADPSIPSGPLCVTWPGGYDPAALFFNSGLTWYQVMNTSVAGGNGYINLAHQYIAAVLNVANGACAPDSITNPTSGYIALATGFFGNFTAGSYYCAAGTGCPLQVTWAAILADYNQATGAYSGLCSQ